MTDTNIETSFPALFQQALEFHDTIKPIAILLVTFGLIIRGFQGMKGDINRVWEGVVTTVIIAILIPTLPEIINQMQLAAYSLVEVTGANPSATGEKFGNLIVGETSDEDVGFIDIILHERGGIGRALIYSLLHVVSFFALVIQYIFFIAQQFLITYGIALSPVFLAMFMSESLKGIAVKYFLGLVAVIMWPLGWGLADIVTSEWLERAAGSSTIFSVVAISVWLLLTTIASPLVMNIVVTNGANAGGAIFQRVGSALGLGASYGIIGAGTAQISGASPSRVAATGAATALGGAVSGATGQPGVLLSTAIGIGAAKSTIGNKESSGEPVDYNSNAAEISKKKKS